MLTNALTHKHVYDINICRKVITSTFDIEVNISATKKSGNVIACEYQAKHGIQMLSKPVTDSLIKVKIIFFSKPHQYQVGFEICNLLYSF